MSGPTYTLLPREEAGEREIDKISIVWEAAGQLNVQTHILPDLSLHDSLFLLEEDRGGDRIFHVIRRFFISENIAIYACQQGLLEPAMSIRESEVVALLVMYTDGLPSDWLVSR